MLLINLLIGFFALSACLVIQALLLKAALRYYWGHEYEVGRNPWANYRVLGSVVVLLVFGNLIQVGIWGAVFLVLGEFSDFATAYYHSAVNFATLGYGDLVMSERYRLLGPLESLNGIMMVGVTTATLMFVVGEMIKLAMERNAENKE